MIEFTSPSINYAAISPMLIIFGVAVARGAGRGVRAAQARRPHAAGAGPRRHRRGAGGGRSSTPAPPSSPRPARSPSTARRCSCRAPCWCSAWAASPCWPSGRSTPAAARSSPTPPPCRGRGPDVALAAAPSRPRPRSSRWPCSPSAGMMLFPASNNLLLMFVALEVLSLPLYLLCGLARRRRLLSQEAAMKYFLLGAFSSAFFLYGLALLYGYAGSVQLGDILTATQSTGSERPAAARWASRCSRSACCSRSARSRSSRGPRTSTRARPPRSPRSWPPAPRWPRSAPCCACSTSRFNRRELGLAADDVGRRDPHHGRRRGPRHHPDRRQADARLLLGGARRVHPHRRRSRSPDGARGDDVLPAGLRLHHDRRVRAS